MARSVVLVLVGALLLGACDGGPDAASKTSAASSTEPGGEPFVMHTSVVIAATSGTGPKATGEVLDGSTLGGSPFCVGGTIVDSHGSFDPAVKPYGLMDRTITCSDGTVRMGFTPDDPQGSRQTGSWTIVSGTGAFEGLRGTGEMEVSFNPEDSSVPARETLTGAVTR